MSDELPAGWVTVRLGDLFDCWGGVTPSTSVPQFWGGTTPWVSSKDIKFAVVDGGTEHVTERALAENRLRICPVGSVLVVVRSGVLAHSLPVAITSRKVVVNQDVKALDSGDSRLNAWAALYLRATQREILEANRKDGTTVQSIRVPELLDRELPVAPPAEQRRIVDKVEALLEQVRRAKERLDRLPAILKRFRQAVLAAAVAGKLTDEWREAHPGEETVEVRRQRLHAATEMPRRRRGRRTIGLSECEPPADLPDSWLLDSVRGLVEKGIVLDFQDGNHGSLYPRASEFGDAGTKFITAKQVFDCMVMYEDAPLLANDRAAQLRIGFAKPMDVLLTHNATVGRVAVLPDAAGNCVLGTSVTYYRLRSELMLPNFCMYFMQSRLWQQQLEGVMEQTTRNQVSVRKQAEFWMVVPPPDEQAEIVRRVDALFAHTTALEQRVERAAARAGKFTQAILSKAFAGELVPTEADLARAEGSDYETAEELLQRVRRERDQRAPTSRSRASRSASRARPSKVGTR